MGTQDKNWYIPFDVMPKNEQDFAFDHLVSYLSRCQKETRSKNKMRSKFQTQSVTDFGYGSKQVKLCAVYAISEERNKEDNQFSKATPSGTIEMMISAEGALDFIKPGKKYYVDFTEAED